MGKAKGQELRWLVVYKRLVEDLPIATIVEHCGGLVGETFVKDMTALFLRRGAVEDRQGQRTAPPANQVMTEAAAHELLTRVLLSPQTRAGRRAGRSIA
tara:strand:- start:1490 stop:1786 length:297 start_codon:yes stop_codon:yes gene_type:complete